MLIRIQHCAYAPSLLSATSTRFRRQTLRLTVVHILFRAVLSASSMRVIPGCTCRPTRRMQSSLLLPIGITALSIPRRLSVATMATRICSLRVTSRCQSRRARALSSRQLPRRLPLPMPLPRCMRHRWLAVRIRLISSVVCTTLHASL